MDALLRVAVAALFLALVLAVVAVVRVLYRRRVAAHAGEQAYDLAGRFGLTPGAHAILFVSTPRCIECVELQEPALERLRANHPVEVKKLWASDVPDVIARFSILTAPSTIVLGPDHRVRAVNVGFADTPVLASQIA